MDHEAIHRLILFWRKTFFTEPILLSTFIFCFVLALLRHDREKEIIFFLFYFLIGILLFTVASPLIILRIFSGKKAAIISEISNTIFELVEFVAFYYFFKKCIQHKKSKIILNLFLISLCLIIFAYFIAINVPSYTVDNIREHSLFINVIEFFFLFILCLTYFYELFTSVPKIDLFKRPSFLIVTGTFFYSVLMIPFFMLANDMIQYEEPTYRILFAFHFILLIIMLITISKAFLCKTRITI